MAERTDVRAAPEGIAIANGQGAIAIGWDDLPAVIEAARVLMQERQMQSHLARHDVMGALGARQ